MSPKRSVGIGPTGELVRDNVARRRKHLQLSAQQVSDRTAGALGRGSISDIERGARRIDVDDLVVLALALECSPLELFEVDEDGALVEVEALGSVYPESFAAWLYGDDELMPVEADRERLDGLLRQADALYASAREEAQQAWAQLQSLSEEHRRAVTELAAGGGVPDDSAMARVHRATGKVTEAATAAAAAEQQLASALRMHEQFRSVRERKHRGHD